MNITTVTVSYGQTQSLPEYSNVKPQLTLTAELEPGEDLALVTAELWITARDQVHELIDQALEEAGRPAQYSSDPRYHVMMTYTDRYDRSAGPMPEIIVILPNDVTFDMGDRRDRRLIHSSRVGSSRKLRINHAWNVARELSHDANDRQIIDCSDGDLSKLEAALRVPEPEPAPTEAEPLPASAHRKAAQPDDATNPF